MTDNTAETTIIESSDLEAHLEAHSFRRLQILQAILAAGMILALIMLGWAYHFQKMEGWALMEDLPKLLPILTLAHVALAYFVIRRDRKLEARLWNENGVNTEEVASSGWKSAREAAPGDVCLKAIEAWWTLRVGGYAVLALVGLGILWAGIFTSELLKRPFYWINLAGYLYWWWIWLRSFPTASRALDVFERRISDEESKAAIH
jgi:hypothetical protein